MKTTAKKTASRGTKKSSGRGRPRLSQPAKPSRTKTASGVKKAALRKALTTKRTGKTSKKTTKTSACKRGSTTAKRQRRKHSRRRSDYEPEGSQSGLFRLGRRALREAEENLRHRRRPKRKVSRCRAPPPPPPPVKRRRRANKRVPDRPKPDRPKPSRRAASRCWACDAVTGNTAPAQKASDEETNTTTPSLFPCDFL